MFMLIVNKQMSISWFISFKIIRLKVEKLKKLHELNPNQKQINVSFQIHSSFHTITINTSELKIIL